MPQPQVLILRAPGTNCDEETAFAFEQAGAMAERVHINRLLENPDLADQSQILCIPGGFSYGDDVAAGRILANQIRHHLADALHRFHAADKLILGICNGFQVLIKSGVLLADDPQEGPPATLAWNDSGRYEDRWVRLGVEGSKSVFLRGIEALDLPVAHAEGKFVTRSAEVLERLGSQGQLVLRYRRLGRDEGSGMRDERNDEKLGMRDECARSGPSSFILHPSSFPLVPYPDNPNGSTGNVAGVCDETGRVLGLMPHPERYIDATQHPHWTRGRVRQPGEGFRLFRNAVEYFG
jgi:phosphoribosylformylglycinamidine (FGAM) synthase-like amidotransferase family enzyme